MQSGWLLSFSQPMRNLYSNTTTNNISRLVIDLKINDKALSKKKEYKKKSKFIITIDAGHGGIDPGAINLGKKEKN